MTKNMTEGNPVGLLISFALPLLAGNLLQQTYNIVDAAIVGKYLGADALAGVGASSSVQFLILGFCIGCCGGFAIPVAQSFGADDHKKMRRYIYHSMLLTILLAVVLTSVCGILCPQILHLLKTPKKIYKNAYIYLFIIFMGIPFTLLYNLLSGILRAVGDSKTPFIFLMISTVLNIILDVTCIVGLKLGCAGAALATVVAQGISGILCLILIIKKYDILKIRKEDKVFEGRTLGTLTLVGVPMGLQFSITAIGSMVLQAANNGLGDIYISGFTAGMRIKQFAMCPFDALATAVSTFASQNYGAHKFDRIKEGIRDGIVVGVLYGIFVGIILNLFGRNLSMLFLNSSEVEALDAAAKYLGCLGLFYWALGFLNVCRLTTQGLGFAGRAVFSGVVEMVARITVSLAFVPVFGFTAVCFADQSAWVSACFYMVPTCFYCVKNISRDATI